MRYRKRYLDLIMNDEVMTVFQTRANVISYIRRFLCDRKFLEVETPILSPSRSPGAGQPFMIKENKLGMELYLRVAPELFLKQLIVGGFSKVFEIGKQFRCENMDMTHNPEFTSCELYKACATYEEDMVNLTEDMLSGLVKELTGGYRINCHSWDEDSNLVIDFTPPFKRIDMLDELEKTIGLVLPEDLSSVEATSSLMAACKVAGLECNSSCRAARLLDRLVDHVLAKTCVQPTFIKHHPKMMSPMAKEHPSKPQLTERFELYINKQELCNAYTELNDPVEQRSRFNDLYKDLGEEVIIDEQFIEALEHGMPPTAGWGIGIDRLAMLLTDSKTIKEVILFPLMRLKK